MARTAECAAPEGNRDRDDWMTVIVMQEYMGASRSKAYDLIWSGEIDSYRLGSSFTRPPPLHSLPRHAIRLSVAY